MNICLYSKAVGVLFRLTVIAASILTSACGGDLCSNTESSRVTSPDKVVDAVVVSTDCGATVADGYRVYITRRGEVSDFDDGSPVFVSDHTVGIKVSWYGNKNLRIAYTTARIFQFTNFWQSRDVDDFGYLVSITEKAEQ